MYREREREREREYNIGIYKYVYVYVLMSTATERLALVLVLHSQCSRVPITNALERSLHRVLTLPACQAFHEALWFTQVVDLSSGRNSAEM